MISTKMADALNKHMNLELYSAHSELAVKEKDHTTRITVGGIT